MKCGWCKELCVTQVKAVLDGEVIVCCDQCWHNGLPCDDCNKRDKQGLLIMGKQREGILVAVGWVCRECVQVKHVEAG